MLAHVYPKLITQETTAKTVVTTATSKAKKKIQTPSTTEEHSRLQEILAQSHDANEKQIIEPPPLTKKQEREQRVVKKDPWYNMHPPEITPEVKRDLQVLSIRHLIYKDRHFKKPDKKKGKSSLPEKFEMGEVVSTAAEFYSSRMTKAEQGNSLVEELLKDHQMKKFAKKKWNDLQVDKSKQGVLRTKQFQTFKRKREVRERIEKKGKGKSKGKGKEKKHE